MTDRDETITSADWSPDGKRLAYDLGGEIYLRTLGDTSSTRLYEGTDPHSLAWSPDGRELVFVEGGSRLWHGASGLANTAPSAILSIPIAGGPVDTIAAQDGINLSPTWGLRGRSLFYISSRDGAKDLYQVPMGRGGRPSGPATRLTTGLNAHTLSMSLDGRWLTFSTLVREANIWMLRLKPGRTIPDDSAVPVTSGNQVIERVSVSSDGRWLLYDSDRSGNAEIYRQRLDQPLGIVAEAVLRIALALAGHAPRIEEMGDLPHPVIDAAVRHGHARVAPNAHSAAVGQLNSGSVLPDFSFDLTTQLTADTVHRTGNRGQHGACVRIFPPALENPRTQHIAVSPSLKRVLASID